MLADDGIYLHARGGVKFYVYVIMYYMLIAVVSGSS